jgi:hypothetical protein
MGSTLFWTRRIDLGRRLRHAERPNPKPGQQKSGRVFGPTEHNRLDIRPSVAFSRPEMVAVKVDVINLPRKDNANSSS